MTLPLLLLTRPRAQSERFVILCRPECPPHRVLIAPLSEIVPVTHEPNALLRAEALIFTSPNAVAAVRATVTGLPAWCVGPGTAAAAREAGFRVRESGGDAGHLLTDLRRAGPGERLVHAHGRHLARDLVSALAPEGFDITGVMVYEAQPVPWAGEVLPALKSADRAVVPLFSPRAADAFAARMGGNVTSGLRIVAISANCAARLPPDLRARCMIAQTPDAAAMCRAVAEGLSHNDPEP
ncbi:MAG: uroporphyrinogen-III synthase [Pararhodobacter sp.]|nr:uroporphyrinogen-III synthase [Pararhodobacter sp.]